MSSYDPSEPSAEETEAAFAEVAGPLPVTPKKRVKKSARVPDECVKPPAWATNLEKARAKLEAKRAAQRGPERVLTGAGKKARAERWTRAKYQAAARLSRQKELANAADALKGAQNYFDMMLRIVERRRVHFGQDWSDGLVREAKYLEAAKKRHEAALIAYQQAAEVR